MSVEYLSFVFWMCVERVVVVFKGCYSGCVLSARLKEFVEVFFVVSDVVCKIQSYVFAFRRFSIFG